MNFFNIGTAELLLIFIIALIVVGPRRLPEIARSLGKIMSDLRRMSQEFTTQMAQELNAPAEELSEVKEELKTPAKELSGIAKELRGTTKELSEIAKEPKPHTEVDQHSMTSDLPTQATSDQTFSEEGTSGQEPKDQNG